MPITEGFVQNSVRDQLNRRHYRRRGDLYAGTETYTGMRRADVLLAFMRAANRPYTVVVEAKSRTTIGNLKLKRNADRQLKYSRVIALILIVGLLSVTGYQWYFNALNSLLLILAFLLGVVTISAIAGRMDLWFTKSISAIEQLAGYPANESWIAVAEDTFVKREELMALRKQCRKNGVGLIVVNGRGQLSLPLKPQPRHVFNDYLSEYGKKKKIMAEIDRGNTDYGPTPAERARTRRQSLVFLLGISLVGVIGLLLYEDRYGPVVPDPIMGKNWEFPEVYDQDTLAVTEAAFKRVPEPLPGLLPCAALSLPGRSFMVLDFVAPTALSAANRVRNLRAAGLAADYLAADCIKSWVNNSRFVVLSMEVFPDRPAAQAATESWRNKIQQAGLEEGFGKVLKVRPK